MTSIQWPWAIVLCKFSDRPGEPQPVEYYQDLYTRHGTGGLTDYWNDVSFGNLDLSGSHVFGWLTMPHTTAEVAQLSFPSQRGVLVQWGRDAAGAAGIDLGPFSQVLVVHNYGIDHGAAGNGILIVHQDSALCEMGFISHEMGHGMGLPHSFSANPDFEYGDGWDLMSFATTTYQFPVTFRESSGQATVGLNARNVEALGVLEASRRWIAPAGNFSEVIVLDPLNQQQIGNHGHLVAAVPRPDGSRWTLEFRHKHGWDQAIPQDAVILHEVRVNSLSYLQPGGGQHFTNGQDGTIPNPDVYFRVVAMTASPPTATVWLWDRPDSSLRREVSKPKVYLMENGTKRWVTSPAVLAWLGRSWAEVLSVPDGALANVPDGPDIVIPPTLVVSVTPHPVPPNRAVTATVEATHLETGAPVAGRVLVDDVDVAATNTPFSYRFQTRRHGRPPGYIFPTVTVRARGYTDAVVDTGH